MSSIRVPNLKVSPVSAVLSPLVDGVGRATEPVLTAARRSGIVAVVVAASSLGRLGGSGEVVYPRAGAGERAGAPT